MKLRVEPQPTGYTVDKAVILIDDQNDNFIMLGCENASVVAREIAQAVNRDYLFNAMVAALTPFKSDEMGKLLIDALVGAGAGWDAKVVEQVKLRLEKLINAVDVICMAVELQKEFNQ